MTTTPHMTGGEQWLDVQTAASQLISELITTQIPVRHTINECLVGDTALRIAEKYIGKCVTDTAARLREVEGQSALMSDGMDVLLARATAAEQESEKRGKHLEEQADEMIKLAREIDFLRGELQKIANAGQYGLHIHAAIFRDIAKAALDPALCAKEMG